MPDRHDVAVCILAGGSARRFGSPKGLAELRGTRLVDIVISRLKQQTSGPIALNASPGGPYGDIGLTMVPDQLEGALGPLAGLHAAMVWAQEQGLPNVLSSAIDVPFLPIDLIGRLHTAGAPVICASRDRWHPTIGLWPSQKAKELKGFIEAGGRSAHAWAKHCRAAIVEFEDGPSGRDPFFNINTPADLEKAAQ